MCIGTVFKSIVGSDLELFLLLLLLLLLLGTTSEMIGATSWSYVANRNLPILPMACPLNCAGILNEVAVSGFSHVSKACSRHSQKSASWPVTQPLFFFHGYMLSHIRIQNYML